MQTAQSLPVIERIVAFCCRWPALVTLAGVILTLAAGAFTATHFAMNTDSAKLISADVGWRKREIQFDQLFPQQSNLILVVIDGKTPELAEAGAAALNAASPGTRPCSPMCAGPMAASFSTITASFSCRSKRSRPRPSNCSKHSPFWAHWHRILRFAA